LNNSSIPFVEESHHPTGAILCWERDHRKPVAHLTVYDLILCETSCSGALRCKGAEVVSCKQRIGIKGHRRQEFVHRLLIHSAALS